MKKALTRIPKFFLNVYEDYPREIQQKMLNLFALCIGTTSVFAFMLIRAIWFRPDIIEAISSIYSISVLMLSLIFIRLKRPVTAGNLSICMIFYVFGNYLLRDLFSPSWEVKQISRINDTAVVIIFGIIITTTYVIRRKQYIFLIFTSYAIYVSHYLILVFHYYGGVFEEATLTPFTETFAILSISLFLSFTTLSLTTRGRGLIFSNIIIYKFGDEGPTAIYSEHPLQGHEESSAGAYFYTTIGQGAQYSTGLFGPIPFGLKEQGKVALIFAARTPDSGLKDPRLQCQNYLMIAMITTPDKISIINRENLEKRLGKLLQVIPDLCNVTDQDFTGLVEQIHAI
jgi:hypothetical protein